MLRDHYRLGRRPALDGLRGAAVLLVVVGHSLLGRVAASRTIGVTLFFVLSGFLITSVLLEEHADTGAIRLPAFYARRARRLGPGLAFFVATMALLLHLVGQPLLPVAAAGLHVADLAAAAGMRLDWMGHTWSLSLEEQFYAVWPVALLVLLRGSRSWITPLLGGALAGITVWRAWLAMSGAAPSRLIAGPDTRADAILAGCLLAVLVGGLSTRWLRRAALTGAATLAVLCVVPDEGNFAWFLPVVTAASVALVGWAASASVPGLCWRPLRWLGRISYGVYLWHYPVTFSLNHLRFWGPGTLGVTLLVSVGMGALSHRFVERPFLSGPVRVRTTPDPGTAGPGHREGPVRWRDRAR